MITQAVIYTRFSPRPNAEECNSCEKQEERCRAYCKRKGYPIYSTQSDPDTSGGVLGRPGLDAAIHDIEGCQEQSHAVLVVDAADRLARDMLVSLTIRHEIEKVGGRIEYANGTPVTETPEGRLFTNILAAFASFERDRVRYATSRGMKRRQAEGEWFGKPPIGFMLDPECKTRLVACPWEQDALEVARKMRDANPPYKWRYIAEKLQSVYGPFRGGHWKPDTLRKTLAREDI